MAKNKKKSVNVEKLELIGEAGVMRLDCNASFAQLTLTGIGTNEFSLWAATHDTPAQRKQIVKAANDLLAYVETFVKNLPVTTKELDTDE